MAATSGISDKVQILEETNYADGGAAGEVVFGVTKSFTWKVDAQVKQTYGLESAGPQATVNTDGVLLVTGTHEWEFTDGRELKCILGDLPTNTGGNYTLDVTTSLPSYSVKVIDDDSDFLIVKGVMYTKVSINMNLDDSITVTADFVAKTVEDGSTFTPTVSSVEPLVFLDGYFSVSGTAKSGVDNFKLDIDRSVVAKRFIEDVGTGSRRLISSSIPGKLTVSFDGAITAERATVQQIWGSTSLQDTRTDTTLNMVMGRGSTGLNLALTGVRYSTVDRLLGKDEEVALYSFSGFALDVSGTGTYPQ